MYEYLELLDYILDNGVEKTDRTGVGTKAVFGYQAQFDLLRGFPLLTTKKMHLKSIIHELLWMVSGDTNVKYLQDNGVRIWDEWAKPDGSLGPVYGKQWRNWETPHRCNDENLGHWRIDQLKDVVEQIKTNPDSRRLIVTAWNPADTADMALPSCHCFFQFSVVKGMLSCHMYQRSADAFLGVPFNIASYALLTTMVAQATGLRADMLVISYGDLHIYKNHFDQVKEQLGRTPRTAPMMYLNPTVKDLFSFKYEDFSIVGYDPWPPIKAEVAV